MVLNRCPHLLRASEANIVELIAVVGMKLGHGVKYRYVLSKELPTPTPAQHQPAPPVPQTAQRKRHQPATVQMWYDDSQEWYDDSQEQLAAKAAAAENDASLMETLCTADDATLEFMGGVELCHKVRMARGL